MPNETLISCPECGAKNKIPAEKLDQDAKCGRCHQSLKPEIERQKAIILTLRCSQCHTKNRFPRSSCIQGPNAVDAAHRFSTKAFWMAAQWW